MTPSQRSSLCHSYVSSVCEARTARVLLASSGRGKFYLLVVFLLVSVATSDDMTIVTRILALSIKTLLLMIFITDSERHGYSIRISLESLWLPQLSLEYALFTSRVIPGIHRTIVSTVIVEKHGLNDTLGLLFFNGVTRSIVQDVIGSIYVDTQRPLGP